MALTTNLVAYYEFDGSNSNDAVGSNNGTDANMSYGAGKINNGAIFNGTSSKIAVPSGIYGLFTASANWSINMWVNFSSLAGQNTFYLGTDGTSTNNHSAIAWYGDSPNGTMTCLRGKGGSIDQCNGSATFSTSTWYMITATYDGSIHMYVNASADGSPTVSGSSVTNTNGNLGTRYGTTSWLAGTQDEVGFWSRALSGAEITQLYNGGSGLQYPFTGNAAGGSFLLRMV